MYTSYMCMYISCMLHVHIPVLIMYAYSKRVSGFAAMENLSNRATTLTRLIQVQAPKARCPPASCAVHELGSGSTFQAFDRCL